jgi:hypothetical protein
MSRVAAPPRPAARGPAEVEPKEAPAPKARPKPAPKASGEPPAATTPATPAARPTAATAEESRARVQGDATAKLRQDQVRRTPTAAEVQTYLRSSLADVGRSEATPEVRDTVRAQLTRVDERLSKGKLTPSVALAQGKLWNQHLDASAQEVVRGKIARAGQIERMGPGERALEGLIGMGTGVLKTVEGVGRAAKALNDLNPLTASTNVLAGTIVEAARTGDLGKGFDASLRRQLGDTAEAAQGTVRTAQAVGQLAGDLNAVNPLLAPTAAVTEGLVGSVRSGDVPGSFQRAFQGRWSQATESAQRLTHLAGEVTGFNKITSGDPRLIGEGVFDAGMLLAPYARARPLPGLTAPSGLTAANKIVPFRRPPASGVPLAPLPKVQPPAATAVLDAPPAVRPRVVTVDAPPLGPVTGGGGLPPRVGVTTAQLGAGASGGDRRLDELEESFRRQNGLDYSPNTADHDRRHALFGHPTNRRGEATINAAEHSFLDDAARRGLDRSFFEPKNLQARLDDFRAKVKGQLDHKRAQLEGVLDKPTDDLVDTHEALKARLRQEGVRDLSDRGGARMEQRLDELYYAHAEDPAAYRSAARALLDDVMRPPSDAELLQRFQGNLTHLHALQQRNPGFTTKQLLEDGALGRELVRARPSDVAASRDALAPYFRALR